MCNKCDVEYRASKNQRLLVELTLLKMTTIGQFVSEKKNNNSQIIAPAKQVEVKIKQEIVEEVPVKEVLHKTVDQVEKVEVVVEEKVEVKTVVKQEPLRRVRKSRFSLSDVMDDKKEVETELNAPKKSENFTESRMREVWMLFAEKINKEGKMNLFITLTSSDPTLEKETLINLKISNDAQEKILDENKIELMDHLRTSLNNDFISLKTELSEDKKSDVPYTPKDKFIKMTEENPHLNTLQQKLGLDPDY